MRALTIAGLLGAGLAVWCAVFWRSRGPQAPPAKNETFLEPVEQGGFVDKHRELGIEFQFFSDSRTDRFFLPEIMGGGAAWFDYDQDGQLDLYLVNGCRLPVDRGTLDHTGALYRNQAGRQFEKVSEPAGVVFGAYGQGVAAGDLDNDGYPEMLVTGIGDHWLLQNHGDGTFRQARNALGASGGWGSSCAFGDLDRDGDLDVYVVRYVDTTLESNPTCTYTPGNSTPVRGYCGPNSYQGQSDRLYRSNGDGSFDELSAQALGVESSSKGLAVVIADLTNDGWQDIYVANDMEPNLLYINRTPPSGALRFDESAAETGSALIGNGKAGASMGIACADFDENGWLDLYVTQYLNEANTLYLNRSGLFVDFTSQAGLYVPSLPVLGFGVGALDIDNDGLLDLLAANGHVLGPFLQPNVMPAKLFRNQGSCRFEDVSAAAGNYFATQHLGRGAAFGDFDNDGKCDVVVSHLDESPALLHNNNRAGHFIGFELIGAASCRDAIGARVRIKSGSRYLVREIVGGGSYLSSNDYRLVIGLGSERQADRVEVTWPSGRLDTYEDIAGDRYWRLVEGHPCLQPVNQP